MQSVARKLCNDIEEPTVKRSTNDRRVSTSKFRSCSPASTRNAKTPRFTHFDRPTTSSKAKTLHPGSVSIIKSKTSIVKNLAETAVNTVVTGPLRCDNNCVTLLRKRDLHSSCKCGQKRLNTKASIKSIQTLRNDFSRTDKACIHCVETATCGTQLFNKNNSVLETKNVSSMSNRGVTLLDARIEPSISKYSHIKRKSCQHYFDNIDNNAHSLQFGTVKRWALSNHPTRGPDF